MHSEDDDVATLAFADDLLARCGGPAEMWRVPGAAHLEVVSQQRDEYARRMTTFLAQVANTP